MERLSTSFCGKRQTAACSWFSLLFLQSLNKSIRQIEKNSQVCDKRETTHFHVETANGRWQKWNFCHSREKQTWYLISLMKKYFNNYWNVHNVLLKHHLLELSAPALILMTTSCSVSWLYIVCLLNTLVLVLVDVVCNFVIYIVLITFWLLGPRIFTISLRNFVPFAVW